MREDTESGFQRGDIVITPSGRKAQVLFESKEGRIVLRYMTADGKPQSSSSHNAIELKPDLLVRVDHQSKAKATTVNGEKEARHKPTRNTWLEGLVIKEAKE